MQIVTPDGQVIMKRPGGLPTYAEFCSNTREATYAYPSDCGLLS
jgi:hypothetical protein